MIKDQRSEIRVGDQGQRLRVRGCGSEVGGSKVGGWRLELEIGNIVFQKRVILKSQT
jgi:hypothetical protein